MAAQVSGVKGHVQMMGVCQGYWQADGRAMTAAWGGPAQREGCFFLSEHLLHAGPYQMTLRVIESKAVGAVQAVR